MTFLQYDMINLAYIKISSEPNNCLSVSLILNISDVLNLVTAVAYKESAIRTELVNMAASLINGGQIVIISVVRIVKAQTYIPHVMLKTEFVYKAAKKVTMEAIVTLHAAPLV